MKTKLKVPYFTSHERVEVEVEISPDDLHHGGWHHENECPAKVKTADMPAINAWPHIDVLRDLHRQAHPDQPGDLMVCRKEPCRSLSLPQVMGRPVAA